MALLASEIRSGCGSVACSLRGAKRCSLSLHPCLCEKVDLQNAAAVSLQQHLAYTWKSGFRKQFCLLREREKKMAACAGLVFKKEKEVFAFKVTERERDMK